MRLRIASVNVNGVRAAFRKGMAHWLADRQVDILALQEVRAETADLVALLGDDWQVMHDAARAKGRAGVAICSRLPAHAHRVTLGEDDFDTSGRWLEADYTLGSHRLTVVSTYVHAGEVDSPKQIDKYRFLDALTARLAELARDGALSVVMGDINIGHRTLDIKNWKGNRKNAGFLPEERAYLDRWVGNEADQNYNRGGGLGFVDVGRQFAGEVAGPYTWWSQRGKAFDTDTGWRIDYQFASPALAPRAVEYAVDRAASYDTRWSDHSPVVVDYEL